MNSGGNQAIVRIYELSGEGNFTNTPLSDFWRDDVSALGNELVNPPKSIQVYPSESKVIEIELADNTQFVGIAADLRNPDRGRWRAIYPIDEVRDRVRVTVYSGRISVEVEGRGGLPLVGMLDRQQSVAPDCLRRTQSTRIDSASGT